MKVEDRVPENGEVLTQGLIVPWLEKVVDGQPPYLVLTRKAKASM